ncbi:uncharacterized protein LOC111045926 isoform X1 [Nilaparvata lugens]|uniref:uncharacterized protein LOC111045926 isoform X1 n=1 Tax=Nilaparvata lugens TaxID=108931 RepID=UPI000B992BAD|nr:uncharacterized protein LOC111045926 isoform X1 [Nilaparvata lugens]
MLWIFRRSTFSNGAAAFLNAINNNCGSTFGNTNTGAKYVAKKSGYNKLACCEDTAPDNSNGNVTSQGNSDENSPSLAMRTDVDNDNRHHTDSSSASDFDLEEEEEDEDFSDESDYEESLTCNVCDRSFCSPRQLSQHQQKKRHFGCGACDSLFQSLMALEHHKEEFEHWSGDDCALNPNGHTDEDEESSCSEETSEEMERLL